MSSAAEQLIRTALEEQAARSDVYRLVLARGRAYEPVPRPPDVEPGARHDAFRNAYRLARARPGLRYCEGYTLPRGYTEAPNRHAWCLDDADTVIDPSPGWAEPGRPLRECYLGVVIPLDFAAPYADSDDRTAKGVLFELTGRAGELAVALGA